MKKKFLTVILALVAALCLCFGFAACDERENSGNTGDGSQTEQPSGSQSGNQGSGTPKPDEGQGGETKPDDDPSGSQSGNQGSGTPKPDEGQGGETTKPDDDPGGGTPHVHSYGDWHTTEEATCTKAGKKQRECSCGDAQYDTVPQKDHSFVNCVCSVCGAVEPGAVEVKVYIDNVLTETIYTSSSKGYKIALPAKPADTTTDPNLTNYFDGWYADKDCTKLLTGEETYSASSAIYGQNITSRTYDFSYTVNNGEATIKRFTNSTATTVVVPRYINSFPVTTIGEEAFRDKTTIRTVFLCEGLKVIQGSAFYNCNSMQKVVLPSSLTSIGGSAFAGCSGLTGIEILDSVTSIGDRAFSGCSGLKSVTIGSGVTLIGSSAFEHCSGLTSVTIGSGVTSIGSSAFEYCSGLTSVTIGSGVTSIGKSAFAGCSRLTGVYITDLSVWCGINFGNGEANPLCYAKHLYLNEYEVKNPTIPSDVKEIKAYAFYDCSGLTSITIPDGVTSIGDRAFLSCSGLKSVTIGSGVTSIGGQAFDGCSGLTSVTIGSGVTSIGYFAFCFCIGLTGVYITDLSAWCGINFWDGEANPLCYAKHLYLNEYEVKNLTIPSDVKEIKAYAFYGCSGLTSITIGSGVTSIGSSAFDGCSGLTSITIPDSATSIGARAFAGCSGLESITIPFVGGSKKTAKDTYQYPFGYIFGTSQFDDVSKVEQYYTKVEQYYYGSSINSPTSSTYYIPDSLKSVTVTGGDILYGAFYNCSGLTSIKILNGVTSIGSSAFDGCSGLTSITIPDSATSIGARAFAGCSGLESITIPFVGGNKKTAKDTYQYPFGYIFGTSQFDGASKVEQDYYGRSINSPTSSTYYIPDSLKSVTVTGGDILFGAFYNCSELTSIKIPDDVTSIGEYALYDCSGLTSIKIPDGVTSIGDRAFYDCSGLTSITIPDGVTSIGEYAFYDCIRLTGTLTIPNSVTSIGNRAFSWCIGLTSVTIGSSVTSIGDGAFGHCLKLFEVWNYSNLPIEPKSGEYGGVASYAKYVHNRQEKGFQTITDDGYIFYEEGEEIYLLGYIGKEAKLQLPEKSPSGKVYQIYMYAFYYCSVLTSVTIPDSVTSIGDCAFTRCNRLESVTIGSGVTSIGELAFYGCSKLTGKLTIPNSVSSIGNRAFSYCSGLTSVTIGSGVTSIGSEAFLYCSGLESITVDVRNQNYSSQDGILYNKAKTGFVHIPEAIKGAVTIPDGVISIGNYVFEGCSGLTSVTIGSGVTSIGNYAFSSCSKLTGTLTIPNSVTSIGENAFSYCSGLTSVTIGSGVTSIGSSAFYDCSGLTSVTIGSGVTSIGRCAFAGCRGLTSVKFLNTSGWHVSEYSNMLYAQSISVSNPETVAIDLRSTYIGYYWKRY